MFHLIDGAVVHGTVQQIRDTGILLNDASLTFPGGSVQSVSKLLIKPSDIIPRSLRWRDDPCSAPVPVSDQSTKLEWAMAGASLAEYLSPRDDLLFLLRDENDRLGKTIIHAIALLCRRWHRRVTLYNQHISVNLQRKLRSMGVDTFNSMDMLLQSQFSGIVDAWGPEHPKLERWLSHQRKPVIAIERPLLPRVQTIFSFDTLGKDLLCYDCEEFIVGFGGDSRLDWSESLWRAAVFNN